MPFDLRLVNGDLVVDPFDLQLNVAGLEAPVNSFLMVSCSRSLRLFIRETLEATTGQVKQTY